MFFYNVEKNSELIQLHETVVDNLNPLREGFISDNQKQLTGLSQDQRNAIKEYGYVSVKKLYTPHISITHLTKQENSQTIEKTLPEEVNIFSVKILALSRFADYGTFPRPSRTYPANNH